MAVLSFKASGAGRILRRPASAIPFAPSTAQALQQLAGEVQRLTGLSVASQYIGHQQWARVLQRLTGPAGGGEATPAAGHRMKPPPEPTVFTAEFCRRLAAVNTARRKLRELGVQILAEQLEGAAPAPLNCPLITVRRCRDQPVGPLFDSMGWHKWMPLPTGGRMGYGPFLDVTVTWEER